MVVVQAVLDAYREVVARDLVPTKVQMGHQAHRDLIHEMGEPAGSRLYILLGLDVVLDDTPEGTVYVTGRRK